MQRRQKIIVVACMILLAAILTVALQDYARQRLVEPLMYLYWSIGRLFEVIPQAFFWFLVLSLCLLVAVRSLAAPRRVRELSPPPEFVPSGRVLIWAKRLIRGEQSIYSRWLLANELGSLALKSIAFHQGLEIEQARQHLREGTLQVEPRLLAYLQAGLIHKSPIQPSAWESFISLIRQRLAALLGGEEQTTGVALDLSPQVIVEYMERMETIENNHG